MLSMRCEKVTLTRTRRANSGAGSRRPASGAHNLGDTSPWRMSSGSPSTSTTAARDVRTDEVAAAEIKSLKPGAKVYERRTPNVFFLSTPDKALKSIAERRKEYDKKK